MKPPVRKTFMDLIGEKLITTGKVLADITNPLAMCKNALSFIETTSEDKFIEEVLNDIKNVDIESLDCLNSLKRLYKAVQVITKATTNDKQKRFRKLTVNGIINYNQATDDEYELFVNIIDELTDTEYLILYKINQIELEHENEKLNATLSEELSRKLVEELGLNNDIFIAYINRLKAKGLIVDVHGVWLDYNTPFYLSLVDGKISKLYKKLFDFINL